jgi:ParB family chromosome partitioning protein
VKQRLRLAELAPPILDALADRQITIDAAMSYATAQDKSVQAEVFELQQKRGLRAHDPASIRHALDLKGIKTSDRLFRFVGAARYEAEGGGYEDDLFSDAARERTIDKPFLLETLANTIVDAQAEQLLATMRADDRWSSTIAGCVKVPDLRLHAIGTEQKMRPPAGFVLVERPDAEQLWGSIRTFELKAHVVVGIDVAGELMADPRYVFVPIAAKAAAETPTLADREQDRQRRAMADREAEILRWARRLAAPPFAGTPFAGRAHWPDAQDDRQVPHQLHGEAGFLIRVMLFVSDAEIAAARKAATIEVDRRIAARAAEGKAKKEVRA